MQLKFRDLPGEAARDFRGSVPWRNEAARGAAALSWIPPRRRHLPCEAIVDAGGIPACSRWLSEATPPVGEHTMNSCILKGCQPRGVPRRAQNNQAGIPPGCVPVTEALPVVSLRSTTGYELSSLRDATPRPIPTKSPVAGTSDHSKGSDASSTTISETQVTLGRCQ